MRAVWKQDVMSDANVNMLYADGGQYQGDWINDRREGRGKMIYSNKDVFEGEWYEDKNEGHGIYKHANGTNIEGSFCLDWPIDTCTVTRSDGKAKKVDFE